MSNKIVKFTDKEGKEHTHELAEETHVIISRDSQAAGILKISIVNNNLYGMQKITETFPQLEAQIMFENESPFEKIMGIQTYQLPKIDMLTQAMGVLNPKAEIQIRYEGIGSTKKLIELLIEKKGKMKDVS